MLRRMRCYVIATAILAGGLALAVGAKVVCASGGPVVVSITPQTAQGYCGIDQPMYIRFDQAIDPATVSSASVQAINNGQPWGLQFTILDPYTVRAIPTPAYNLGVYSVTVTEAVLGANGLPATVCDLTGGVTACC